MCRYVLLHHYVIIHIAVIKHHFELKHIFTGAVRRLFPAGKNFGDGIVNI